MESYKAILDNLYDGIYFVDAQRRITYWNNAATTITGFGADEVVGRACFDNILKHIDDTGTLLCKTGCPLAACLRDGQHREAEVYLHHKNGHRVPVRVRISPILDKKGRIIGAAELFSDNSALSAITLRMAELEQLAMLDTLTRLANRRYIETSMEGLIKEMDRYQWCSGILFMDVDNFKQVNDTYGHEVGDAVLKQVATTLITNSRAFDLFGRWGGEEFVGEIRNVNMTQIGKVAEKLRILIANTTIPAGQTSVQVTVSIGATLVRVDDSVQSIIKRADQLMYMSKKNGKNRVTLDDSGAGA